MHWTFQNDRTENELTLYLRSDHEVSVITRLHCASSPPPMSGETDPLAVAVERAYQSVTAQLLFPAWVLKVMIGLRMPEGPLEERDAQDTFMDALRSFTRDGSQRSGLQPTSGTQGLPPGTAQPIGLIVTQANIRAPKPRHWRHLHSRSSGVCRVDTYLSPAEPLRLGALVTELHRHLHAGPAGRMDRSPRLAAQQALATHAAIDAALSSARGSHA